MWIASGVGVTGVGLNPIYLFTGSVAAILAVAISLRSIIKSMLERSKEEALQKQSHNEHLQANTRAIEKLDLSTAKLADKLEKLAFDATMRLEDHERRLERLERTNGIS